MKKIIILIISGIFFLIYSKPCLAIKINEFYPAPNVGETEWIELYNEASSETNLAGWRVYDQLSNPSLIKEFIDEIIAGQSYLVIELSTPKLNNDADGMTLKNSNDEIIDEVSYQNSQAGKAWSLINNEWQLSSPSAGLVNPAPASTSSTQATPTPSSSETLATQKLIQFSEIYPCPQSGETEWVKLFNSANELIELTGWQLADSNNNFKTLDFALAAKSYATVSWDTSILNNSGDQLILTNTHNQIITQAELAACQEKGNSFIYKDNIWQEDLVVILEDEEEKIEIQTESNPKESELKYIPNNLVSQIASYQNEPKNFEPPLYLPGIILGSQAENFPNSNIIYTNNQTDYEAKLKTGHQAVLSVILGSLTLIAGSVWPVFKFYKNKKND